jgi:hypothetical protein
VGLNCRHLRLVLKQAARRVFKQRGRRLSRTAMPASAETGRPGGSPRSRFPWRFLDGYGQAMETQASLAPVRALIAPAKTALLNHPVLLGGSFSTLGPGCLLTSAGLRPIFLVEARPDREP